MVSESHVPFAIPGMTCPWNVQFLRSGDDQALIPLSPLFVWPGPHVNGPGDEQPSGTVMGHPI